MSDKTRIAWCDATWNPLRGCSRVSEGCRHCYAEAVASRFSGEGMPYHGLARDGRWTGVVRLVPEKLDQPLRWRRPRRIFVNSMSDLFHEKVSDADIGLILSVMALAEQHTFQVITKRPKRMRDWLASPGAPDLVSGMVKFNDLLPAGRSFPRSLKAWPLPNVHLGVSVEDQATAEARIPVLLDTPAAVRFVSYEPALGPVDFEEIRVSTRCVARPDWIIVGGESGPRARPCDVAWIRSAVEQCRAAGVPCFAKQLGSNSIVRCDEDWSDESYREVEAAGDDVRSYPFRLSYRSRAGADPAEWPADLRVQEFPR